MENISTIHADVGLVATNMNEKDHERTINDVLVDSKNISAKIDNVNKAAIEIRDDMKNDSKDMKDLVSKLSNNVSSLVEHLKDTKPDNGPSVRPNERKENEKD